MQKRNRDSIAIEPEDVEKARKVQEDPLVLASLYKVDQVKPGDVYELPREMWKNVILKLSPGTFFLLISVHSLFKTIDEDDWVWQQFFKRDFPVDYAYVGKQLPFYATRWRYFYLHTRHRYVLYYEQAFMFATKQSFADMYDDAARDFANTRIPTSNRGYVLVDKKMPWFMYIAMCYRVFNTLNVDFAGNPKLRKYLKCQQFKHRDHVLLIDKDDIVLNTRQLIENWAIRENDGNIVSQTIDEIYESAAQLFQDEDLSEISKYDTMGITEAVFKHMQRVFRYPCLTSLMADYNCEHALRYHGSKSLSVLSLLKFDPAGYGHASTIANFKNIFSRDPRYKEGPIKYLAACASCLAPNPKEVCGGCKSTAYCREDCAKKDWQQGGHFKNCQK